MWRRRSSSPGFSSTATRSVQVYGLAGIVSNNSIQGRRQSRAERSHCWENGFGAAPRRLRYPAAVVPLRHRLRLSLVVLVGWIKQQQRDVIDNLLEESRSTPRARTLRLRFTNDQRVRARKPPHSVDAC